MIDELEFAKPRRHEACLGWRSPMCKGTGAWGSMIRSHLGQEKHLNHFCIPGASPSVWEGMASHRCWRNEWHVVQCGGNKAWLWGLATEGELNGTKSISLKTNLDVKLLRHTTDTRRLWSFISPVQALITTLWVNKAAMGKEIYTLNVGQFKSDGLVHS